MDIPSDRYWNLVITREDYDKFIGSGMAWEVEPDCPETWTEHLEMKKLMEKNNA
jgi:hypothetical protein